MEDINKEYSDNQINEQEEEDQFYNEVIQGEHTLLYIDTYLRDIFKA